jgi:hypothetical protein
MNIPANAGKPFSFGDDEAIRELYAKHRSVALIAATLQRTEAGIKARLERLGLVKAGRVLRKQAAMGAS